MWHVERVVILFLILLAYYGRVLVFIYLFVRQGVAVLASVVPGGLREPKVTCILFSYLVGRETPPPTPNTFGSVPTEGSLCTLFHLGKSYSRFYLSLSGVFPEMSLTEETFTAVSKIFLLSALLLHDYWGFSDVLQSSSESGWLTSPLTNRVPRWPKKNESVKFTVSFPVKFPLSSHPAALAHSEGSLTTFLSKDCAYISISRDQTNRLLMGNWNSGIIPGWKMNQETVWLHLFL